MEVWTCVFVWIDFVNCQALLYVPETTFLENNQGHFGHQNTKLKNLWFPHLDPHFPWVGWWREYIYLQQKTAIWPESNDSGICFNWFFTPGQRLLHMCFSGRVWLFDIQKHSESCLVCTGILLFCFQFLEETSHGTNWFKIGESGPCLTPNKKSLILLHLSSHVFVRSSLKMSGHRKKSTWCLKTGYSKNRSIIAANDTPLINPLQCFVNNLRPEFGLEVWVVHQYVYVRSSVTLAATLWCKR